MACGPCLTFLNVDKLKFVMEVLFDLALLVVAPWQFWKLVLLAYLLLLSGKYLLTPFVSKSFQALHQYFPKCETWTLSKMGHIFLDQFHSATGRSMELCKWPGNKTWYRGLISSGPFVCWTQQTNYRILWLLMRIDW